MTPRILFPLQRIFEPAMQMRDVRRSSLFLAAWSGRAVGESAFSDFPTIAFAGGVLDELQIAFVQGRMMMRREMPRIAFCPHRIPSTGRGLAGWLQARGREIVH